MAHARDLLILSESLLHGDRGGEGGGWVGEVWFSLYLSRGVLSRKFLKVQMQTPYMLIPTEKGWSCARDNRGTWGIADWVCSTLELLKRFIVAMPNYVHQSLHTWQHFTFKERTFALKAMVKSQLQQSRLISWAWPHFWFIILYEIYHHRWSAHNNESTIKR